MDRQTLIDEAARQGYRLTPIDRIKKLDVNLKLYEFLPEGLAQEYIDNYIRCQVVDELYKKMDEYKKIGKFVHRYNEDECHFDIRFSLEVIVPDAPAGKRTTPENYSFPLRR